MLNKLHINNHMLFFDKLQLNVTQEMSLYQTLILFISKILLFLRDWSKEIINSFLINISIIMSLRKAKQLLERKKLLQRQKQNQQVPQQQQTIVKPKISNVFAMFGGQDTDSDHENEVTKEQKLEQKGGDEATEEKKKKKKKKNKNKSNKEDEDLKQLKEVQDTLKELGFQPKAKNQLNQEDEEAWTTILAINQGKFNYQRELRRHFRGWELEKDEGDPDLSRKEQKMQKHLKKMMKKSVLSPGIGQFFQIREKFEIEREDNALRFQATKKYDSLQRQYEIIKNSNDVNALFQFTQFNPEHVDSLYAVGEFLRLQGNYRDADGLIQRVIYIYEMAGGYELGEFLKEPFLKKYIVYNATSISFFMSLFKFMDILGKKGCFRSALQYNKLLLKINLNDPTACLLCIDFNAISSKQYEFLITFVQYFSNYVGLNKSSIYLMPNFTYSLALAKFLLQSESTKESQLLVEETNMTQLLQFKQQHWSQALILPNNNSYIQQDPRVLILRAIMVFPKLILEIAIKNQYSKQFLNHQIFIGWQKKSFQQIMGHQFWTIVPSSYSYHFLKLESVQDSQGLDKVLQVYVERSKILWKSSHVMLWTKGALGFVLNKIDQKFDYQSYLENLCLEETKAVPIPFNLSRYSNINKHNFSDRVQRIDLNNIQDNQQQVRQPPQGQPLNMNQNPFSLFLNSLLPWVNLPNAQVEQAEYDPDMPFIEEDHN